MTKHASAPLAHLRILVAEDEYMIADEVASVLREAGAEVLGPLPSFGTLLEVIAAGHRMDGALVDVNLRGIAIWPAVDALRARGIPVMLTTGYETGAIPVAYASLPRCEKPATGQELVSMLARLCADRSSGPSGFWGPG